MVNNFVLIGRIASDLKIKEAEGKKECSVLLAVARSYKNEEGIYETDFINCYLYGNIAKNTAERCQNGDMVGVRGHIQTKEGKLILVVDKLTFLSSKKGVE